MHRGKTDFGTLIQSNMDFRKHWNSTFKMAATDNRIFYNQQTIFQEYWWNKTFSTDSEKFIQDILQDEENPQQKGERFQTVKKMMNTWINL